MRLNDECADKIYDIRERSDVSRDCLLNSGGVAPRFYQMEADAVSSVEGAPCRRSRFVFLLSDEESLRVEQHEEKIRRNQTITSSSVQIDRIR